MNGSRTLHLSPLALTCIAWVYACGGDGSTEPPPDPPRPTAVAVNPARSALSALGATAQLSAEVRDQNGQVLATTVTWASDNTSAATVNTSGLVTAAGNGTATISATAGQVSGSATVTVAQQVSAVEVVPGTGIVLPEATLRLMAEAKDANAHVVEGAEFEWASSDSAVAVVDATGLVTGIGRGSVEVSATSSGIAGRAQLEVVDPGPTAISVAPDTVVLGALGDTVRLTADVHDQIGRPMAGEAVMWTVSDTLVATVDSTGLLTAGNGVAAVAATSGPISGEAAVQVMQVARQLSVTPSADTLILGDSLRLVAGALDSNRHPVPGATFTWSSGDPWVATVDSSGVVHGVGEGAAEITVATGIARQTARISVFSPDRAALMALYEATNGEGWADRRDWASEQPLAEWFGVEVDAESRVTRLALGRNGLEGRIPTEIGDFPRLTELNLFENALTGPIPSELGDLAELRVLHVGANRLTGPIPPELGGLSRLEELGLDENELTGAIPPELGNLTRLEVLWLLVNRLTGPIPRELGNLAQLRWLALQSNWLTGVIPAELGRLTSLEELRLDGNYLAGPIPSELGDLSSLRDLLLADNELTGTIPAQLGNLEGLVRLELGGNGLEGLIPEELGQLRSLTRLLLHKNDLSGPIPAAMGNLNSLQLLSLAHNDLSGPVPAGLSALAALEELRLNANPGLSGFLPDGLRNLGSLNTLLADGTSLCAPADVGFLAWLGTLENQRVARCRSDVPAAYLVQAVQSLDFPVPLIADRPALLRVFLTAPEGESVGFPPVRARFYLDEEEVHTVDIPSPGGAIPAEVGEGSLEASANVEVPAEVVQPGLELVVEIDPDQTLGAGVGITRRIPEIGRQAIDVRRVPPVHLTLLPVLRPGQEESGFLERIAQFTKDDTMFWPTRLWLPVAEFTLEVRETHFTTAATSSEILREIEAIRVLEGGTGYYMGGLPSYLVREFGYGGLAFRPGRSSLAHLDSTTVAHELGHNMILMHAPCGGANLTNPDFPDRAGRIGGWGFDPSSGSLVPPETADVMSSCDPRWISTFDLAETINHRLAEEVTTATAPVAGGSPQRTLLVWGGVDAAGLPFLDPAFVVDARPTLPRSGGPYTLTGKTGAGEELFSIDFAMQEMADGDEGSGFVFALPLSPAWADLLKVIELSAPGGVATLDETSDRTMALLRDTRTGRVRGILRDHAKGGSRLGAFASVAGHLEILVSPGLPTATERRR